MAGTVVVRTKITVETFRRTNVVELCRQSYKYLAISDCDYQQLAHENRWIFRGDPKLPRNRSVCLLQLCRQTLNLTLWPIGVQQEAPAFLLHKCPIETTRDVRRGCSGGLDSSNIPFVVHSWKWSICPRSGPQKARDRHEGENDAQLSHDSAIVSFDCPREKEELDAVPCWLDH